MNTQTFTNSLYEVALSLRAPVQEEFTELKNRLIDMLKSIKESGNEEKLDFIKNKITEMYVESENLRIQKLIEENEKLMLRRQSFIHSNTKNGFFKNTRFQAMKNDAALFEMDNLSIDELKTLFS